MTTCSYTRESTSDERPAAGKRESALIIRGVTPADENEWLRLRPALWPDASGEEHRREMGDLLSAANEFVQWHLAGRKK